LTASAIGGLLWDDPENAAPVADEEDGNDDDRTAGALGPL
jgi:hypothetical protein